MRQAIHCDGCAKQLRWNPSSKNRAFGLLTKYYPQGPLVLDSFSADRLVFVSTSVPCHNSSVVYRLDQLSCTCILLCLWRSVFPVVLKRLLNHRRPNEASETQLLHRNTTNYERLESLSWRDGHLSRTQFAHPTRRHLLLGLKR